jgi:hypothetical protein
MDLDLNIVLAISIPICSFLASIIGTIATIFISRNNINYDYRSKVKSSTYKALFEEKIKVNRAFNIKVNEIENILNTTTKAILIFDKGDLILDHFPETITEYYREMSVLISYYKKNILFFSSKLSVKMDKLVLLDNETDRSMNYSIEISTDNNEIESFQRKDKEKFYNSSIQTFKECSNIITKDLQQIHKEINI